jgi:hypothetical protein
MSGTCNWIDDAYGTHQPFLETYVRSTTGDVLEFGAGHCSTGFLRNILAGTGRKLVSIEDSLEWVETLKSLYPENEDCSYVYLESKEGGQHWKDFLATYKHKNNISVVFIDQSPWEARALTLWHYLKQAEYCIVHDADYFCNNPTAFGNGTLGEIADATLHRKDEARYKFHLDNYRLYMPPSPWSNKLANVWGPPTLVTSGTGRPIIPYGDIMF